MLRKHVKPIIRGIIFKKTRNSTQSRPQLLFHSTHFLQATSQKNWTQGFESALDGADPTTSD